MPPRKRTVSSRSARARSTIQARWMSSGKSPRNAISRRRSRTSKSASRLVTLSPALAVEPPGRQRLQQEHRHDDDDQGAREQGLRRMAVGPAGDALKRLARA
jgi:hypothetical protein